MLCRGYNADTHVYVGKKNLNFSDVFVLVLTLAIILVAQVSSAFKF